MNTNKKNDAKRIVKSAERAVDAVYFYWRPQLKRIPRNLAEVRQALRDETDTCLGLALKLKANPLTPPALVRVWNARATALRWAERVVGKWQAKR